MNEALDSLKALGLWLLEWGGRDWFTIGDTPVNLFRLIGLIIILTVVWYIARLLENSLTRVARRSDAGASSGFYALARLARYAVWIVGSLIGLNYMGFSLASLSLLGGAIGVGIGFGLQNIFSNFISGIILLLDRSLKIGDFVQLESGVMGKVQEIGMRYTRITTNDLVDIIVPNSEFINGRVINWSYDESVCRLHIPFGVAYGSDKDQVKEAAIAAARKVKGTIEHDRRPIDVWLVNFGESSLDFELVVWVEPEAMYSVNRTRARYLWAIEDELRARNIEIPFPQRDLHIRSSVAVPVGRPGEADRR